MAATSSFTEGSSVFGGQANLLQAIQNIFAIYEPDVIAVHTTCLSETIGDDIPQIIAKARDEKKIPAGKYVIHANTPSYVGSHVTGFSNMVRAMVNYFAGVAEDGGKGDRHLFCEAPEGPFREKVPVPFPRRGQNGGDQSHPRLGRAGRHARNQAAGRPAGGRGDRLSRHVRRARRAANRQTRRSTPGAAQASTPCGGPPSARPPWPWALPPPRRPPGSWKRSSTCRRGCWSCRLDCGPPTASSTPCGKVAGVKVPAEITEQRGRLLDMITDMHQYFYGKRVALWGDPDQLVSLVEFLTDLDMRPVYVVTGTPGQAVRRPHGGGAGRPGARGQVPPGRRRRHVPHAPVDQAGAGRFAHRQHLRQVHRPRRGHSPSCGTVSRSSTAWGTPTSPRSATGRDAPLGNDPQRACWTTRTATARKKASSW